MKTEYQILIILFIHWIADFIIQTDEQAKGKSKSWKYLLAHTWTYTLTWFVAGFIYAYNVDECTLGEVIAFCGITFIAHTVTDYFTSRLNSKLWAEGKVHSFFVSIGFDQFLHYVQLILCFIWLR